MAPAPMPRCLRPLPGRSSTSTSRCTSSMKRTREKRAHGSAGRARDARRGSQCAVRRAGLRRHATRKYSTSCAPPACSLCAFNPLNPADNRTGDFAQRDHRKIVVVDGQTRLHRRHQLQRHLHQQFACAAPRVVNAKKDGWRDTQIQVQGPAAHRDAAACSCRPGSSRNART